MACLADYPAFCRHDLDNELHAPQARLISGDYALVPIKRTHRSCSDRPLAHYINDDNALDIRYPLRHRSILGGASDDAIIDRHGPFLSSSYSPRYRSLPHLCDDADHLDLPDANWRLPYTYPLQCMEPGGVRWSPEQIHAYNRDVLRHNNQIARRRNAGLPDECMMLLPMMDSLGRFPPGFDRPLRLQEFFNMDESLIDSHRQHYGLPHPENLERLLLINSAERQLLRGLKQIQLLELYGARLLAEQYAVQLLHIQDLFPGLRAPRSLGYGLGPEFEETYLSPWRREHGGLAPLEILGYGSGLVNWNPDVLVQMRAGRGLGPEGVSPWGRAGMHPGIGMGMSRGYGFPGGWPSLPYAGAAGASPGYDPRRMGMSGERNGLSPFLERIACDGGGRAGRHGSFN
ncbi:hypothetical protein GJ744_007292 [Endocarpon pusillum]|uniref:Uncharacterized protein n=1 Tax=Endocarpon pusillum TaxID=364733 RepID=A0A8H7AJ05_9EURO|nr:hypothetical protein GJ744_007292 [Endocarpon pusillum]